MNQGKTDLHELNEELEHYRQEYMDLQVQNRELQAQAYYYHNEYLVISNSAFWKLTKPFRILMDFLKFIFRHIKPLRKIWHGLKYIKKNGFQKTWKRIFGKKKSARFRNEELESIYEEQRSHLPKTNIRFSILVPLYNTDKRYLAEMIESVKAQTYPNWELCLADGSDDAHPEVECICQFYANTDDRIRYKRLEKNAGISENSNACAKMATGDYLAFLDHDDLLSPAALYMNVKAIMETNADLLYSDEDHLSPKGEHVNVLYKPDWSPDLLMSQMYICHLTVLKKALFEELGGFHAEFDGSQDYDLILRASEKTDQIVHIPTVLYTWRECETSTAANADSKPYAHEAGRRALDAHLKRVYGDSAEAVDGPYTFVFDARFHILGNKPMVSIIIPMKDHWELSDACINSILKKTTYSNYEILILNNRSAQTETFTWFEAVSQRDSRVRVIEADMDFNWSKLNNFGILHAKGEVFVFLNNDTLIITPDWLERLTENALRTDIGIVGGLLLYEDNTIQHAGVVVGLNGFADHVFKGMDAVHFGSPFVSPMVSRNVLAVTGACMAISRKKIEEIGLFDESFVICGSDVELCLRAYESGYFNRYDAGVRLYHLESKSRDSYIPPIDVRRSIESYGPYLEDGDPFYNCNLNLNTTVPEERVISMNMIRLKKIIKRCPPIAAMARKLRRKLMPSAEYKIPEIEPFTARKDKNSNGKLRLNLLTPSVDMAHVFGGISTAIKFFDELRMKLECDVRIISTDAGIEKKTSVIDKEYVLVPADQDSNASMQLVAYNDRYQKTIPVRENDIFMATAWWTAYTIRPIIEWQSEIYGIDPHPLLYFIQDYEPGFYPWSSRYMLADSTYRFKIPTYAILNSGLLKDFFDKNGYSFTKTWYFEPVLNEKLANYLPQDTDIVHKKPSILVYGRPSVDRNAFALVVESLKIWVKKFPNAKAWEIYSAGEEHDSVDLGEDCILQSLGKLTLEDYAKTMLDTYVGLSLMVSPHPSYPPLEMSTFGVKLITNCYANKDLNGFNPNITCVEHCSPDTIAEKLCDICENYNEEGKIAVNNDYAKGGKIFGSIVEELSGLIDNFDNKGKQP
ncbi:MAG: glycosyltransferase family 2 protein [Clostridia bacterium]|nr:glycosyltransferase family 2 protein [Clostridia bacterium]